MTKGAERGVESVEALVGHTVVAEPSTPPQWTHGEARAAKAAPLRIYLGAAPGVGKTYAMLSEGRRRAERGTHVELMRRHGLYASMWDRQREATEAEERLRLAREGDELGVIVRRRTSEVS